MLNWQATDRFSVQGGFDFNKDDFINSVYGLQDAKSWALNLDASYAASQNLIFGVFYSHEDLSSRSAGNGYTANSTATNVNGFTAIDGPGCFATIAARNASNKVDPCNNWTSDQKDKVDTVGLNFTAKNVMPRFDVLGNFIYTRAHSDNNPFGGTYTNNPFAVAGAPAGTPAAFFIPATPLPTVKTETIELRLTGRYTIDKNSSVRLLYTYAHMTSSDYAYTAMQDGGIVGQFPTFEKAPSYTVHIVGATYIYTF
jgi:hypothetical protein